MRSIILWRGYHSKEVASLIEQAWRLNQLLILYPPGNDDVSFLPLLPEGELAWAGDWPATKPITAGTTVGGPTAYPDTPILGVFSTGTEGQKLVLYSKRNVESCLKAILSLFNADDIETVFCYPQPFHTFGLVLGYVHCLLTGRRLVATNGPYSTAFHEAWFADGSTKKLTLGTPTHFSDLMAYVSGRGLTPRETYSSIVGAAKVSIALWQGMRDELRIRKPSIGYGATEASPGVSHLPLGQEPREDAEVGYPLPHLKVTLTPEGLEFRGPGVCLAIVQNGVRFPDKIVIPDDIERRLDGVMVYRGRAGLLLNRGGEKFSLEKMESTLREALSIEVLCVSLPDERLGEELGVLAESPANAEDIYSCLREHFHREFNPRNFLLVRDLPVNASAKLDRKEAVEILMRVLDA